VKQDANWEFDGDAIRDSGKLARDSNIDDCPSWLARSSWEGVLFQGVAGTNES